jgi:hypothetical protein
MGVSEDTKLAHDVLASDCLGLSTYGTHHSLSLLRSLRACPRFSEYLRSTPTTAQWTKQRHQLSFWHGCHLYGHISRPGAYVEHFVACLTSSIRSVSSLSLLSQHTQQEASWRRVLIERAALRRAKCLKSVVPGS